MCSNSSKLALNTRGCIWIILIALFPIGSVAQQDEIPADSVYKLSFPQQFTTRLSLSTSYNDFYINDRSNDLEYVVTPETEASLTVSLLFRSFEIDLGFTPKLFNDENSEVDTEKLVFNFRMYLGRWIQSLDFYNIEGFVLDQANFELGEEFDGIFADLKVTKIGGTTGYVFNPNYSFRAISFQNEWQTRSAGSFIPRLSYYFTRLKLPGVEEDDYFDLTAGPAYFYNWVIARNWIIAGGASAGIGVNHTRTRSFLTGENNSFTGVNYQLGGRIALGYNSKRVYTGINLASDYFIHSSGQSVRLDDRQNFFEIYFGYRFDAPQFMLDAADWFNNLIGWE
jgi:hypothetical protein